MAKKKIPNSPQREQWSNKSLFIMACIGSAIGLGNIWMFPWRMGTYGGSAFLLIYVLIVVFIGLVALMGEYGLGRSHARGPIGSLDAIFREKKITSGKWFGLFAVITTFTITVFYMVVVGWVIHYFVISFKGFDGMDLKGYFGAFAGTSSAVIWHVMAVILATAVAYLGVKKGLEPINKFMMPGLFIVLIILVIRAVTLPGATEGIKFMFAPNFAALVDPLTWLHALSQALFSLSLFGTILVVYGSYLTKNSDVPVLAGYTAFFDTVAALLAAFIVFPAAFAFGVTPGAGVPLMFITLPGLFAQMPGGTIFGILFFLLVIFAAVTSAISLMEAAVEPMMDLCKWSRKQAALVIGTVTLLGGLPLALNMAWFGSWVRFTTTILAPIGVLVVMIAFFWIYGSSRARKDVNEGASFQMGVWWEYLGKYFAVGAMLFILISGILRFYGIWK